MEIWQKLSPKRKNGIFLILVTIIIYYASIFSFVPTIKAIRLSKQLKSKQRFDETVDVSLPQVDSLSSFYLQALKTYEVVEQDRENKLWQAVSGIAVAKDVSLSFNPELHQVADSLGLLTTEFSFKGNYFNCIKLIDSISKTQAIGRISSLKLSSGKESLEPLNLQLSLVSIPKK